MKRAKMVSDRGKRKETRYTLCWSFFGRKRGHREGKEDTPYVGPFLKQSERLAKQFLYFGDFVNNDENLILALLEHLRNLDKKPGRLKSTKELWGIIGCSTQRPLGSRYLL